MIINTAILIQEYTFRPPFSTVLQNLRFLLKICTTAPHQTPKTALSPSLFVMQTSVCTDMLSHPHYPSPRTTALASLVKGEVLSPKKFGRLPEGLLHHPSHNYNKPLLRHHSSQRRQLTRIGKHKKNPHCLFWQWGFGLVYRFYFKYLPTSTAGAEVSGAGLPEQSSVYPPTEIPVISPLPSSVSV